MGNTQSMPASRLRPESSGHSRPSASDAWTAPPSRTQPLPIPPSSDTSARANARAPHAPQVPQAPLDSDGDTAMSPSGSLPDVEDLQLSTPDSLRLTRQPAAQHVNLIDDNNRLSSGGAAPSKPAAEPTTEPVVIELRDAPGASAAAVVGSFTNWLPRPMPKVYPTESTESTDNGNPSDPAEPHFAATFDLPTDKTHQFRFIINGEPFCSAFYPTATDTFGNLVNYLEFSPPTAPHQSSDLLDQPQIATPTPEVSNYGGYYDIDWDEITPPPPPPQYCTDIPAAFCGVPVRLPEIPRLPVHLDSMILNNGSGELDPPNHVVLNHLATSSVKHNVLAVASITRYSHKFITEVMYAPMC